LVVTVWDVDWAHPGWVGWVMMVGVEQETPDDDDVPLDSLMAGLSLLNGLSLSVSEVGLSDVAVSLDEVIVEMRLGVVVMVVVSTTNSGCTTISCDDWYDCGSSEMVESEISDCTRGYDLREK